MKLSEKLLLGLSRKLENSDYKTQEEWNPDNALFLLYDAFPGFIHAIKDKEILDFGCGAGYQAVALAKNGAKYVLGLDINKRALEKGRELAEKLNLNEKVNFSENLTERVKNKFDIVISQDSMEHFLNPLSILNEMKSALKQNGDIFITFGPPWFAPYGSHMQFFTRLPWVNILFDERTVMKVRSNFRNDGAMRYEEVEGGLNKMTVSKFERIVSNCGMKIKYKKYKCVKGINFPGTIPLIRELFINQVICILSKHY